MHLKTFSAPTITEAMETMRMEMGEKSVIIASRTAKKGAVITAAVEDTAPNGLKILEKPIKEEIPEFEQHETIEIIRQSLLFHGVPLSILNRLTELSTNISAENPTLTLAATLENEFSFDPISTFLSQYNKDISAPRILLMGAPGVGKTLLTAKLAAHATEVGNRPRVITTDTQKVGKIEQLKALTKKFGIKIEITNNAKGLIRLVQENDNNVPIIVDTSGTNPFDATEMEHLKTIASTAQFEKIAVIAAGRDPVETAEVALGFSTIGAKRMVITQLDMTRRLGSILTATYAGKLSLSDISISPNVSNGFCPLNSVSLARLIMPYTDTDGSINFVNEDTNQTEAII